MRVLRLFDPSRRSTRIHLRVTQAFGYAAALTTAVATGAAIALAGQAF